MAESEAGWWPQTTSSLLCRICFGQLLKAALRPFRSESLEEDKFEHLFGQGPFGERDCPLCGFMSLSEHRIGVQKGGSGGDKQGRRCGEEAGESLPPSPPAPSVSQIWVISAGRRSNVAWKPPPQGRGTEPHPQPTSSGYDGPRWVVRAGLEEKAGGPLDHKEAGPSLYLK